MFKVIKEFVPQPMWLLMCDNRHCAASATQPANLTNPDDARLSQSTFLKNAGNEGWAIGLDVQLCPGHAAIVKQQAEEAVERGKQQVVTANGGDVARFGKPTLVNIR